MHLIRLGGSALNQTPLDWDGNRDRILAAIAAARTAGVAILCLPELCVSGYGCEDAFLSPGVQRMAWRTLSEIVPHTAGIAVAVGLPVRFESGVYDAAAFIADGRLAVGSLPRGGGFRSQIGPTQRPWSISTPSGRHRRDSCGRLRGRRQTSWP